MTILDSPVDLGDQLDGELSALCRAEHPQLTIWQSLPALAVSQKDTLLPTYAEAVEVLRRDGVETLVRKSGGSAVFQSQSLFNLTLIWRLQGQTSIPESYRLMCRPMMDWLGQQGISSQLHAVDGAFCDGSFNIAVGGKKLAGTAQRWQRRKGECKVLGHISIVLSPDYHRELNLINEFYRLAGKPMAYRRQALMDLQSLVGSINKSDNTFANFARQIGLQYSGSQYEFGQ
ncbi:lipoyl protein ligase domain-containing protein [Shewanella corallii]|uniref:lipoyl protein ligase domain-containing protein n=1 Tax=Shewanella corallii TaxID=560080 RepID=UPI003D1828F4